MYTPSDSESTNFNIQDFIVQKNISSTGLQSQIDVGLIDNIPAVRKLFGQDLSLNEKEQIVNASNIYRNLLRGQGMLVPALFTSQITSEGISTVEEYIEGKTIEEIVRENDDLDPWDVMIYQVCSTHKEKSTNGCICLDVRPGNWINGQNGSFFVDIFPPPLISEAGEIYPWIQSIYKREKELFQFNYIDCRGQFTRLLLEILMFYPDRYKEIETRTLSILQECLSDFSYVYIKSQAEKGLPDMRSFYFEPDTSKERLLELLNNT
jgi:hypothetical protein